MRKQLVLLVSILALLDGAIANIWKAECDWGYEKQPFWNVTVSQYRRSGSLTARALAALCKLQVRPAAVAASDAASW